MAITKHPTRTERAAAAFIANSRAADPAPVRLSGPVPRTVVMVRVPTEVLARIDHAARRLGISRTAFMISAASEKMAPRESD